MAFSINGGGFSASFHLPSLDVRSVSARMLHGNLFVVFHCLIYISLLQNEKCLRHGKMVKEIGNILNNTGRKDPLEGLVMIDTLQRLSIDYHFREEIESFLKAQYMNFRSPNHPPLDVFGVALCFRLLRQEGYNVSQGEQVILRAFINNIIKNLLNVRK